MLTSRSSAVEDTVRSDELMVRNLIALHRISSNAQLKHEPAKSSSRHKNTMTMAMRYRKTREVFFERCNYRSVRGVTLGETFRRPVAIKLPDRRASFVHVVWRRCAFPRVVDDVCAEHGKACHEGGLGDVCVGVDGCS